MQLRNLTPFGALCYGALDPDDREHRVVAMKVGYRLVPSQGTWQAVVMDDVPMPLCLGDEPLGDPGESGTRRESDLAPFKPKCDVLLHATAHAPGGQASPSWPVRLRVSSGLPNTPVEPERPQPLNPFMALTTEQLKQWERNKAKARELALRQATQPEPRRVWLDKRLVVSGPSEFRRGMLRTWHRTRPTPVEQVPLRWELAFGGSSRIADPSSDDAPPLLNEVCFSNPLGRGWSESRLPKLLAKAKQPEPKSRPAPQVEYPDETMTRPCIAEHPQGELDARRMAELAQQYGHRPAGFGPLGRAWAPRLQRAGTYDQAWLEQRHPGLPPDFDYGYWNAAPEDQQTPYLPTDVRLELWHLTDPALTPNGALCVDLPGHQAFVLMRLRSGVMLPLPMVVDTLDIDAEALTVGLTFRTWIPAGTPVRVLEARFETDPAAPLLKTEPRQEEA